MIWLQNYKFLAFFPINIDAKNKKKSSLWLFFLYLNDF